MYNIVILAALLWSMKVTIP